MKSFLWKIYLFRFLEAVKPIGVIFVLLFQHNGLTTFEISLLITIWSATQLVLEVPLGVFADKYPRRNLLVIALLLLVAGYCLWLRGGFLFYALGFIFWGAKNALTSGTLEAFIYDELKHFGEVEKYEKVNGKLETFFWIGVTLSAISGGLIASLNFNFVLLASIFTTILSIILLMLMKPVQNAKSTGESKYLEILKEAIKEIRYNKKLLWITIFFCLVFATYGAADEYWSLVYQHIGIPLSVVGFFVAAGYGLFSIAGSTLNLFKFKNSETILIFVSGIIFILAGILNSYLSIPLLLLALYLFKISHIKWDVKFQHAIESGERATISSLKSLMFEIVYMGMVLSFGFSSTKLGIMSIPSILGIALLCFVTGLTLLSSKRTT
ncbi:MAG: MFS transporter [Patescibacteria group bacterium]